jgi:hypothetical protein
LGTISGGNPQYFVLPKDREVQAAVLALRLLIRRLSLYCLISQVMLDVPCPSKECCTVGSSQAVITFVAVNLKSGETFTMN